jgi:hypothetical protein
MVAWALPALLAATSVEFKWSRDRGAESCPGEEEVRSAVSARLGYDPFSPSADTKIDAHVFSAGAGLKAVIEVTRPNAAPGRRELASATGDCGELAAALQLAIAIAIDPHYLARKEPPKPAEEAPAPSPPAAAPAPPSPPPSELHFVAVAGALGGLGVSPSVAPGFTLGVRAQLPRFELSIEGRADLASHLQLVGGQVTTAPLLASISPCFRTWKLGICALGSVGALQVTGELGSAPVRATTPLVLVGARIVLELMVNDALGIEPWLEVQAVVTRTTLKSGDTEIWVTPPVAGVLGARLSLLFF